jgi:hypothetical protein
MPYNVSVGSALPWTGAVLQLALENMQNEFSKDLNISLTLLYNKNDRTCGDAEAEASRLMADYYYTKAENRCVVVTAGSTYTLQSDHKHQV